MKYIIILSVFLFQQSCKTSQTSTMNKDFSTPKTLCPEEGVCTFEVLQNKSLKVLKDDFGATYPEISDGKYILLKFEYSKNKIPNTADSGYRELIYIELNPNNLEVELKDNQLKNVKLTFARLCYCKGQTGYYIIDKGNLSIKKISENTFNLSLQFSTDEVPQIITQINETFEIN